ncbi:MAG: YkgJ family cysteine cluster protein [Planctomycetota bacterium]
MAVQNRQTPVGQAVDKWYQDGLRFECQPGCVLCCCGGPGDVSLSNADIQRITAFLGISVVRFKKEYTRTGYRGGVSLIDIPERNYSCMFLGETGCRIYPVRPAQCRTFPFWPDIIASLSRWDDEKPNCPGVGRGRWYSADEIDRISSLRGDTDERAEG